MRCRSLQLFFAVMCAACDPLGDDLGMATYSTSYPDELRGFVSTTYRPANIAGWDWNRCVPDPIGQIENLRRRGDVVGFNMGAGFPDVTQADHWQGIQRLGVANRHYFAVSTDQSDAAYFAVAHMASRNTGGHRLRPNRLGTDGPDWDNRPAAPPTPLPDLIEHTEVVNPSFKHPGGLQTLGRYLFVPLEGDPAGGTARVFNYDMGGLTDPWSCDPGTGAGCPQKLWGFVLSTTMAATASIARLGDGRYLLITAREDSDVLEFYLSTAGRHIAASDAFGTWGDYEAIFDRANYTPFRTYYQNLNLIVACDDGPGGYETGQLYLLGTTGQNGGNDYVSLFELSIEPGADPDFPGTTHTVHMELAAERNLFCTAVSSGRQCNFDAAAGVYVDPDGRLILYATEHDNDGPPGAGPGGSIKMMEYRGMDHLDDPDTAGTVEGCPNISQAFVELYDGYLGSTPGPTSVLPTTQNGILVEYADRALRNYRHFDDAYDLNDDILSIRYCIPPGYKYRIFSTSNHDPSSTNIDTFRGDGAIAGDGNPSNGTIKGFRWSGNFGWSSGCFMTNTGSTCL